MSDWNNHHPGHWAVCFWIFLLMVSISIDMGRASHRIVDAINNAAAACMPVAKESK